MANDPTDPKPIALNIIVPGAKSRSEKATELLTAFQDHLAKRLPTSPIKYRHSGVNTDPDGSPWLNVPVLDAGDDVTRTIRFAFRAGDLQVQVDAGDVTIIPLESDVAILWGVFQKLAK